MRSRRHVYGCALNHFVLAKQWIQSKCLSIREWVNRLGDTQNLEGLATVKASKVDL